MLDVHGHTQVYLSDCRKFICRIYIYIYIY